MNKDTHTESYSYW